MNKYWQKDLNDYDFYGAGHAPWGKYQAGFTITREGKIDLTDNRPFLDRMTGEIDFPTHRTLRRGYSGLYSFRPWLGEPTQLWLYPDAERNLTTEMANGLASLIGVHLITPNTPVFSNHTRKILFRLKDTDYYKQIMQKRNPHKAAYDKKMAVHFFDGKSIGCAARAHFLWTTRDKNKVTCLNCLKKLDKLRLIPEVR